MGALTPAELSLIDLALQEDLGRGDVTTEAVVDASVAAEGEIVAREAVVVAGMDVAMAVLGRVAPGATLVRRAADGDKLGAGGVVLQVKGQARALLAAERTALNFLQRLSGIATLTRSYCDAVQGTGVRIADTRKTHPGSRSFERAAVRAGGGSNHRFDLGSGVLIKDNHVAVAGGVAAAVMAARQKAPHGLKIEVEVDTLDQLEDALAARADIVLLDNFGIGDIRRAVERVRQDAHRPLLEISGGITLAGLRDLAETGIDVISIGALTHSARAVDLSLELRLARP